jgi:uncharacterized protein YdeI (YjbR/CyaY-like superfamily)
MEITDRFNASTRTAWREWLAEHHASAKEIWLVFAKGTSSCSLTYLDAVEEAICFGWIDGIAKRASDVESAQRFTPRRERSNWTELNKERARRLIKLGLMTEAGMSKLPDLEAPFVVPKDVLVAINQDPSAKKHFRSLPELYVRVRIGYIAEACKQRDEFNRRLQNFVAKTAAGKLFGNWNDDGKLGD